jgi:subtilase family serine protease
MKTVSFIIILLTIIIAPFLIRQQQVHAQFISKPLHQNAQKFSRPLCDTSPKGRMRCHTDVLTDATNKPLNAAFPFANSFGPTQLHLAYSLPCTPKGPVQEICPPPTKFGPQTLAIVTSYHAPNIEQDLKIYSTYFGLPDCTVANGCLTVLNQNGSTLLPQVVESSWAVQTALQVETAHALCQTCRILLLEANSNQVIDLATAVNTGAHLGATAITNGYGAPEWSGQTSYDGYFNHPGTAITFSTGDSGYGVEYPAASPQVTAVGGTTLQLYTDNTYASESVWSKTGSGCSLYELASSWQLYLPNWKQLGCGLNRAVADVSADADPATGVAVYSSTSYNGFTGWWQMGGTTLASTIIASIYALHGELPQGTIATTVPYLYMTQNSRHDIATGKNGICGDFMCTVSTGYDGPTGLGTPNGLTGFGPLAPSLRR